MKMNYLEYSKLILEKVSFDKDLFEKELCKAIHALLDWEVLELRKWCIEKFDSRYRRIIQKCFCMPGLQTVI